MRAVCVAYSGGRDSTALLHAVARAAQAEPDLQVWALHVHHGLSVHADAWLVHAQQTCLAWAAQGLPVQLRHRRVRVHADSGDSVEAVAREARYAALHEMAIELGCDLLLLAHHRQDQAETLLLQALRGAGVAGLAAMPFSSWRDGVRWVRPWLNKPRADIEAYVHQHGLAYIEDDSNTDECYARNRLRQSVWPALLAAFPHAEEALAASAGRVADMLPVLSDWHAHALPAVTLPQSDDVGAALWVPVWTQWDAALRREALREWYRRASGLVLPSSWVVRLADDLPAMHARGHHGHWPAVGLSFYRGSLSWLAGGVDVCLAGECEPFALVSLSITAPGDWPVPEWGGVLRVQAVQSGGVLPSALEQIVLQARSGGEQFQSGPGRPARSLKKQYQAAGVPAWARGGPLVCTQGQLLFVPGLGVDARFLAPEGALQWSLVWLPNASIQGQKAH